MHTLIETPSYLRAAGAALTAVEREAIVTLLAENPETGELIVGTGGCRKVRIADRGKGKSGGYRVVTFFSRPDIPIFLLNVFET